jgi:hypothetical protein
MQKNIVKITVSSLFVAALVAAPLLSRAEEAGANAPAASDQTRPAKAKKKGTAFLGSLVAVAAFRSGNLNRANLTSPSPPILKRCPPASK